MASWFSAESLKSFSENAAHLAEKVHASMPAMDHEMIQKLSLTTPELSAERARIDAEERRKENVRDKLAGMLPWETRDPDRDILVEECREAILKLSSDKETFMGPWQMPVKGVKLKEKKEGDEDDEEVDDEVDDDDEEEEDTPKPSKETVEKLQKLEPLPPLLQEFDLDSHVGLIKRLLKEDPHLVKMQSTLSGGGEREKTFWHNYFFHCAFTRYEAGLSIDEIWSEDNQPNAGVVNQDSHALSAAGVANETATEEETITFGEESEGADPTAEKAFPADPETDANAPFSKDTEKDASVAAGSREGSDFEMVPGSDVDGTVDGNDDDVEVDYELDELEAEIARELED